jgi:molecular chaperone DnaJ
MLTGCSSSSNGLSTSVGSSPVTSSTSASKPAAMSAYASVKSMAARFQSSGGKKDLYQVLGIQRNAPPEEIKAAYKRKAKTLHPDVNPSPKAAEDFAEAKQAFDTLSDPQKRSMYDMTGNSNAAGGFGGGPGGGMGFNPFAGMNNGGGDGANPFGGAGGNPFGMGGGGPGNINYKEFEEMFSKMAGGGGGGKDKTKKPQGPEPGADIHFKLKLTFMEAVNGCKKEISYNTFRRCGTCSGSGNEDSGSRAKCVHCGGRGKKVMSTGFFHMQQDCTHCGGTGETGRSTCTTCSGKGIVKDRSVQTLPVPKGVNSKERLKITGKGEAGVRNGPPGNLYVEVTVDDHSVFHRDGCDIHVISPIPLSTAVLGGTVQVETLTGEVEARVPTGTQQGDKLVLRGRGVQRPSQNMTGDMYIHFAILLPKELTEAQKQAVMEFAKDEKPLSLTDPQLQELKARYSSWFTA